MPQKTSESHVVGFKETAEYFETRARRARNESDHEHYIDAARFYRELAAITPGLPPNYKAPKHVNRARRYRNRAEECRVIAEQLRDSNCRRQLVDLAATYENLAATYEESRNLLRDADATRQNTAMLPRQRDVSQPRQEQRRS